MEPIEPLSEVMEVVGIFWEQVQGPKIDCESRSEKERGENRLFNLLIIFLSSNSYNCGGNGTTFLYFPPELVIPCVIYEWEVTVILQNALNLETVSSTISMGEVEFLAPPSGNFV